MEDTSCTEKAYVGYAFLVQYGSLLTISSLVALLTVEHGRMPVFLFGALTVSLFLLIEYLLHRFVWPKTLDSCATRQPRRGRALENPVIRAERLGMVKAQREPLQRQISVHEDSYYFTVNTPHWWTRTVPITLTVAKCSMVYLSTYILQMIARGIPFLNSTARYAPVCVVAGVTSVGVIFSGLPTGLRRLLSAASPVLGSLGIGLWMACGGATWDARPEAAALFGNSTALTLSAMVLLAYSNNRHRETFHVLPDNLHRMSSKITAAALCAKTVVCFALALCDSSLLNISGLLSPQENPSGGAIAARVLCSLGLLGDIAGLSIDVRAMQASPRSLLSRLLGGLTAVAPALLTLPAFYAAEEETRWEMLGGSILVVGGGLATLAGVVVPGAAALFHSQSLRDTVLLAIIIIGVSVICIVLPIAAYCAGIFGDYGYFGRSRISYTNYDVNTYIDDPYIYKLPPPANNQGYHPGSDTFSGISHGSVNSKDKGLSGKTSNNHPLPSAPELIQRPPPPGFINPVHNDPMGVGIPPPPYTPHDSKNHPPMGHSGGDKRPPPYGFIVPPSNSHNGISNAANPNPALRPRLPQPKPVKPSLKQKIKSFASKVKNNLG